MTHSTSSRGQPAPPESLLGSSGKIRDLEIYAMAGQGFPACLQRPSFQSIGVKTSRNACQIVTHPQLTHKSAISMPSRANTNREASRRDPDVPKKSPQPSGSAQNHRGRRSGKRQSQNANRKQARKGHQDRALPSGTASNSEQQSPEDDASLDMYDL